MKALTLNAGGTTPPIYVTVSCYYIGTVCSGGGDFDVGLACGAGNNATEVVDASGNCYYRKNFGVNGIVDARQCGVVGDGLPASGITGHPDDATLLNNCITYAGGAGYHIVTTGGGVILDNTADIEIKDNITLTCGGSSITAAKTDYRILADGNPNLSKAIVLNPTTAGTGPFTVRLTGDNSALAGCTVEAGAGPDPTDNPYSPSIWFPGCDPVSGCGSAVPGGTSYLRSAVLEASAFNPNPTAQYHTLDSDHCGLTAPYHCGPASQSVGVTIDGAGHATVRDVAILGFGTCLKSDARDLTVEDCRWDCATAFDLKAPDAPFISNVRNERLLTGPQG